MAKKKGARMRRMLRALDLPEEADLESAKFTMLGSRELMIENHRGILGYTAEEVRVATAEGVARVRGEGLVLTELGGERIFLSGRVTGWMYEA